MSISFAIEVRSVKMTQDSRRVVELEYRSLVHWCEKQDLPDYAISTTRSCNHGTWKDYFAILKDNQEHFKNKVS